MLTQRIFVGRLLGSTVTSCNGVPVYDIPDGVEVVGAHVLVVKVVCVLPDINSEQRHTAGGAARVLVSASYDLDVLSLGVECKPTPARALDSSGGGAHVLLERVKRAPLGGDSVSEVAFRLSSSVGSQVFPKQGVVDVSATVEFDSSLKSNHLGYIAFGLRVLVLLERGVQVGDVGLVVLGVVDLHNLGTDRGLESPEVILEIGQLKASRGSSRELALARGSNQGASGVCDTSEHYFLVSKQKMSDCSIVQRKKELVKIFSAMWNV
mmetsp:Transcript_21388/g.37860  ORF Transcript_21388/g.37860 Transcript_21388/m.37860 type:complete len:266 (-) Transcript_21388:177-974(-)